MGRKRRRRLRALGFKLSGVRILALVGSTGTGKSFRAHLIAERRGIDLIIDDGLIIKDRTILFGQSSKKELTLRSAVRRALFEDPGSCALARRVLRAARFRRALILGTSEEMVNRIASNLELPRPSEIFRIENIASPGEIDAARSRRRRRRMRSLPLPPVRVKLSLRGKLGSGVRAAAAAAKALYKRRPLPPAAEMLSVAFPGGEVVFTELAVGQMVQHCIREHNPRLSLGRLTLTRRGALHVLQFRIRVPFGGVTSGQLHDLREYITRSLENYAGILADVTLVVETIESGESPS